MGTKSLIENVYLFKGLSDQELDKISQAGNSVTYNAGDDIFNQNEEARALYVIKMGSVKITQEGKSGDNIDVATLGTGSHFGEMAFVDGEKRSASAVAMEKTEIVVFDYQKLQDVLDKDPAIAAHFYRELSHFLCGRLRITTNDLSFARERNLSHF